MDPKTIVLCRKILLVSYVDALVHCNKIGEPRRTPCQNSRCVYQKKAIHGQVMPKNIWHCQTCWVISNLCIKICNVCKKICNLCKMICKACNKIWNACIKIFDACTILCDALFKICDACNSCIWKCVACMC